MARTRDLWKDPARRGGRGKRWLACWIGADGKEHTKAFAKQALAKRYAESMEADAARGTYVDPRSARVTVSEWCGTWLAGYSQRPATVRQAGVHIRQIRAEFGPLTLGSVRPSRVRSWTARLLAGGHAPSYVHALHRRLAQIMGAAVEDGLIRVSPCSRKTSPGTGSQRPCVATTEQVWALHDAMPARLRPAVLLGAFAGLRLAETCGLRAGDVDFMRGVVHPAVQYPGEPLKTPASRQPIPIPQSMALELARNVTGPSETNNQSPSETSNQSPSETSNQTRGLENNQTGSATLLGVAPTTLAHAVKAARVRVPGLPGGFRYHDLRHYFASLLIASGADVKTVQARLRHKSAKTTLDTYSHLWPDRDESTRAAVEAVFQGRSEQGRNAGAGL
jgi:integrase